MAARKRAGVEANGDAVGAAAEASGGSSASILVPSPAWPTLSRSGVADAICDARGAVVALPGSKYGTASHRAFIEFSE